MSRSFRSPPDLLLTVSSVTGVTLVTLGTYLVAVLLIGRSVSRESFGVFSLWIAALNVLGAVSLFGYPASLLRNFPLEQLRKARWFGLFAPLTAINLGICLAGAWIYYMVYPTGTREASLLFLAAFCVGLTQLPATLLQIFRRFVLAQALLTLWRPVLFLGVLLLLAAGTLQIDILFSMVLAGGFIQLVRAVSSLRGAEHGEEPIRISALTPDALVFGGLQIGAILLLRLDSLFLGKLLDMETLGTYSALSFVSLTGYGVVSIAVGQVLRPKLASGDPIPLKSLTVGLLGGGLLVGALLTLVANTLVPALFSAEYSGDHRVVVGLLAAAGVFQVLYAVPSSKIGIVSSTRTLRAYLPVSLLTIAVDVVLLLWLVPKWGLSGAAAATALTWFWRTITAWVVARF